MIFSLGHIFEKIADICESAKENVAFNGNMSELY